MENTPRPFSSIYRTYFHQEQEEEEDENYRATIINLQNIPSDGTTTTTITALRPPPPSKSVIHPVFRLVWVQVETWRVVRRIYWGTYIRTMWRMKTKSKSEPTSVELNRIEQNQTWEGRKTAELSWSEVKRDDVNDRWIVSLCAHISNWIYRFSSKKKSMENES